MLIQINTCIVVSGYDIGFDLSSESLLPVVSTGKNVIIFGADMSSSVRIDNKGKDILILGKGLTQGLDDTTIRSETKYPINSTKWDEIFVLSLHCNGSNSFLFINATKIFHSKEKSLK